MKRLLVPLAAAGLSAAALAFPATAEPTWVQDPLAPKPADAYSNAFFWLDGNGAALKKATQYHWDAKDVPKLMTTQAKSFDGKPGMTAPITSAKPAAKVKNVNLPRSLGKVFFLDRKGNYRWCSATSIQSRHRNLVATAGHCVYEDGKDVYRKWVFVPGYYQGKAPYGVYAGAYAFTTYDLDVYDDYDGDYAFVAVHNGFTLTEEKEVTKKDWDAWKGDKWVKNEEIKKEEFVAGFEKHGAAGPYWSKTTDLTPDKVGHDYPGEKTLTRVEVTEAAYKQAPASTAANQNGERYEQVGPEPITESEYRKLAAEKAEGKILATLTVDKDAKGNEIGWWSTRFFIKQWVKLGKETRYYRSRYIIGLAKDTGKLGDAVGGQGFAWNQPKGQPVYAFGYPGDPHPDGDKPFTGVTPKFCYGKTGTKTYQVNTFRVEEHQVLKCSMTGGADGGPWLLKYDNAKRAGYVNGVTSLFADQDGNNRIDLISSAYFDSETADVYNKATLAETKSLVGPNGEILY
ncbi:trypsin-like serine peptidase [Nonomuraea typhae]|uniref:trypsin-like serine peptidase n=1 Tax=Nonomuraea typhae TaxID=2603600 RepID=UPI0012F9177D|nr:hypothetical protein [Nonomuraea typhae]